MSPGPGSRATSWQVCVPASTPSCSAPLPTTRSGTHTPLSLLRSRGQPSRGQLGNQCPSGSSEGLARARDTGEAGQCRSLAPPLPGLGPPRQHPGEERGKAGGPGPHQECGAGGTRALRCLARPLPGPRCCFQIGWRDQVPPTELISLNPQRPSHGVCARLRCVNQCPGPGAPLPSTSCLPHVSMAPSSPFPTPPTLLETTLTRVHTNTHALYLRAHTPGTPTLM